MSICRRFVNHWFKDQTLLKIVKNSGYLLLSSLVGVAVALVQGPADYGIIGGVTALTANLNRLFSFRMGEVVVKYAGQALAVEDRRRAAAVIKGAAVLEGITSVFSYGILMLAAGWAAQVILKTPESTPFIFLYGLMILGNLTYETSTGVMQLTDHFGVQSLLAILQSLTASLAVMAALLTQTGIWGILFGYLAGKLVQGIGSFIFGWKYASQTLGAGWWKVSCRSALTDWREILKFAVMTNLSGTVNLVTRDSEVLWANYFLNPTVAGYYKFAQAVMGYVSLPINPMIASTYPQITARTARREWKSLQGLLVKTGTLAGVWSLGCLAGFLLSGRWILSWLGKGMYLPSFSAVLILLLGYTVANTFFWNRPLLLALGNAKFPLINSAVCGAFKIIFTFVLVPKYGFPALAALLSTYLVFTVAINAWKGLQEIIRMEKDPQPLIQERI